MGRSKEKRRVQQQTLFGWWQKYGLDPRIVSEYDLDIQSIEPVGKRWRLETDRGAKCLTRYTGDEAEILFMHNILEYLAKRGFKRIPRLIRTRYGQPYVVGPGEYYYLSDWFEGREVDFSRREQLALAAETLARLHQAGQGFESLEPYSRRQSSDWLSLWKHCTQELVEFKEVVEQKTVRTRFDNAYLEGADHFIAQATKAIERLQDSAYQQLLTETGQAAGICHPRYEPHHLLLNHRREVFVLGFEHCTTGLPVFDLGRFIQRVMARGGWEVSQGEEILSAYQKVCPLNRPEWEALLAFLGFPSQFWQYAHAYYCQEGWYPEKKLLAGLRRVLKEYQARGLFLNWVDDYTRRLIQK